VAAAATGGVDGRRVTAVGVVLGQGQGSAMTARGDWLSGRRGARP